jgi:iron complex transport system permease protein
VTAPTDSGPATEIARRTTPEDLIEPPARRPRRRVPGPVLLGGLGVALLVACVVAVGSGAFVIAPGEIVASIADRLGLHLGTLPSPTAESVLWNIRLPRVALAVVVGAALGCGGAAMQGSFSNPLAEPGIVGVSSGAALGAVAAIVTGASLLGTWTVTGAAFIGGLIVVLGVYWAARSGGRTEVVTLILTGIAVNAFVGALIGLLMFVSTDAQLRTVTFWNLGSLAQATWPKVLAVTPAALVGIVAATTQAHRLDLLALGDRSARHIGVDVERLRILMLTVVAVLTAAAVAVSGIILFVGLVVPHLVRMVAGPGHRLLLPASALGGAVLLVVADLVARTIAPPAELPLGVLTALVGSPFFFWMLRRTRASQGGWA